jgi:Na+-translocating ferredoxin:NAD+ oxidoreductase RnfD subunit
MMNLKRFLRTPKGILIVVMVVLAAVAAIGSGPGMGFRALAAGAAAATIADVPVLRWRDGRWTIPDGAFLTGLFVAMILSPHEPWYIVAAVSAIAVVTKYLFRAGNANVFNPAALALVSTFYIFDTGQSWWGALAELPGIALVLLIGTGVFITQRVNKVPAALAFLICYFSLFTATAFAGDTAHLVAIYRSPDLHAALFFAFFMVTDPPTSPPKQRDQLLFGAIVAISAYAVFELVGAAYFLLAGLLAGNLWEAWRRSRVRRSRRSEATLPREAITAS